VAGEVIRIPGSARFCIPANMLFAEWAYVGVPAIATVNAFTVEKGVTELEHLVI